MLKIFKRPLVQPTYGLHYWPLPGIKVYKLFGERGWCSARKYKDGLFLVTIDTDTVMTIDLKENKIDISPRPHDISKVLPLAFSVSILHLKLLCTPYKPKASLEIHARRSN